MLVDPAFTGWGLCFVINVGSSVIRLQSPKKKKRYKSWHLKEMITMVAFWLLLGKHWISKKNNNKNKQTKKEKKNIFSKGLLKVESESCP